MSLMSEVGWRGEDCVVTDDAPRGVLNHSRAPQALKGCHETWIEGPDRNVPFGCGIFRESYMLTRREFVRVFCSRIAGV